MKRGDPVRIKRRAGRPKIFYVRQVRPWGWILIEDDWYHISQLEITI